MAIKDKEYLSPKYALKIREGCVIFHCQKNSEIHKRILVNKEDKENYELHPNGEQDLEMA